MSTTRDAAAPGVPASGGLAEAHVRPAAGDGAARFVARLRGLAETEDRGALAALRRGLGKPLGEAAEMYPYIVPWVPEDASRWEEDCFYLVGALFAWHPQHWTRDRGGGIQTNFGASLERLRRATESAERTLVALLNSQRDDLPSRLRRAVGLLRSHDVPVDWAQLLRQLRAWDAPDRRVQRAWAGAFWGTAAGGEGTGDAAGSPDGPASDAGEAPAE
jgi:CRISPR system Cascade subunit CasB